MTRHAAGRKPIVGAMRAAVLALPQMRRLAVLCLVLALGAAGPEQANVRVERFADPLPGNIGLRGEQRYSLVRGDVTAILSYVPTSVTLTLRMEGRPPPVSTAEQASLLEPLLARFLEDHPKTPRITLLLTDHTQVVARLAAVLASCANWNGRTGRPARGALGQFLVDTINRHGADHRNYAFAMQEMRGWLAGHFGAPTIDQLGGPPISRDAFSGKKGIIAFDIHFTDANGHLDLWDGHTFYDEVYGLSHAGHDFFDMARRVSLWVTEGSSVNQRPPDA